MTPVLSVAIRGGYGGAAVLRDVRFEVLPGEILGLAGRSGAGKTTIARAILGLLRVEGEIRFGGRNLPDLRERELRRVRGRSISLVPQSPIASLNPALRLEAQFREAWSIHSDAPFRRFKPDLVELLRAAGLPGGDDFLRRYPGELSVGLAQRVLIAMALLHRPALIVADEPTSALDLVTQADILALFRSIHRRFGASILYISHDLVAMTGICDRIAVLDGGEIVECAAPAQLLAQPRHEFTRRLVAAIPTAPGYPAAATTSS